MNIDQLEEHQRKAQEILDALFEAIENLPDNPRINRLENGAFTVNLSDTGNNLSPAHHDFKLSYQRVADALRRMDPRNVVEGLVNIIETGRVGRPGDWLNLHEDVIKHLRSLLDT